MRLIFNTSDPPIQIAHVRNNPFDAMCCSCRSSSQVSVFEGVGERHAYLKLRTAATAAQACRRGAVQRRKFLGLRTAVIAVQAIARGGLLRRKMAQQHTAATHIKVR